MIPLEDLSKHHALPIPPPTGPYTSVNGVTVSLNFGQHDYYEEERGPLTMHNVTPSPPVSPPMIPPPPDFKNSGPKCPLLPNNCLPHCRCPHYSHHATEIPWMVPEHDVASLQYFTAPMKEQNSQLFQNCEFIWHFGRHTLTLEQGHKDIPFGEKFVSKVENIVEAAKAKGYNSESPGSDLDSGNYTPGPSIMYKCNSKKPATDTAGDPASTDTTSFRKSPGVWGGWLSRGNQPEVRMRGFPMPPESGTRRFYILYVCAWRWESEEAKCLAMLPNGSLRGWKAESLVWACGWKQENLRKKLEEGVEDIVHILNERRIGRENEVDTWDYEGAMGWPEDGKKGVSGISDEGDMEDGVFRKAAQEKEGTQELRRAEAGPLENITRSPVLN